MKKVYLVPHVHWDREWYFTAEESKNFLVNDMAEYLDRLTTDQELNTFTLDGQTSILEDYLVLKSDKLEIIKEFVKARKLFIGPWYTLTDLIMLNGETIVRNLMYGIKDSLAYGDYLKIGYVPDPFGSCAQMPQILNKFDINNYIFWRGLSERHHAKHSEFIWKGLDHKSEVFTYWMPLGYAIGKYLPLDKDKLKKRLDKYFSRLWELTTSDSIIIPHGHDQMPIQKDILQVIEVAKKLYPDVEFIWSDYQTVIEQLKSEVSDLQVVQGEFNDGKYMRVHRSIYSTRNDLTILAKQCEHKLLFQLEPLLVLAAKLGIDYPKKELEIIWKLNFENHAHDSISKCNSDKVNNEIAARFLLITDKITALVNFITRKIADNIKFNSLNKEKIIVVNALPFKRTHHLVTKVYTKLPQFELHLNGQVINYEIIAKKIIDPGLIDRQIVHYGNYEPFYEVEIFISKLEIGGLGYSTLEIIPSIQNELIVAQKTTLNFIENDFFKITVNPNGSCEIFNKLLNKNMTNAFNIIDGSDDGDEYDYSPLEHDWIIDSLKSAKNVLVSSKNSNGHSQLVINYELDLPIDIEQRKQQICSKKNKIKLTIDLFNEKINLSVKVINFVKDHRMQIIIPNALKSTVHFVDVPYGIVERSNKDELEDKWQELGWEEKPCSIFTSLNFVQVKDDNETQIVSSKSLNEYEIDDKKIAFTIFRSIGFLGKENLYWRPGRPSGIKLPTPKSQLLNKEIKCVLTMNWEKPKSNNEMLNEIHSHFTPFLTHNINGYNALRMNSDDLELPENESLLSLDFKEIVYSGLTRSIFNNSYALTVFNANLESAVLSKFLTKIKINNEINFLGQVLAIQDHTIDSMTVKHFELI